MKVTALLFVLAPLLSYSQDAPVLLTPEYVNEHLNDPKQVLLQVGYLQLDYDREHIPGARFLWPP